jgi:hypothetical protein
MKLFYDNHSWAGTQHCLREKLEDKEYQCVNDHTGCIYNDGHDGCMFDIESNKQYDSPLIKKNYENRNSP